MAAEPFRAQALATAEFGVSLPGVVAQPAFSMIDSRSQGFAYVEFGNHGLPRPYHLIITFERTDDEVLALAIAPAHNRS
jgi:hypothetical protein